MELIKQIEQKRIDARKDKDGTIVSIISLLISEAQRKQRNMIEGITEDMVISSAKKLIEANNEILSKEGEVSMNHFIKLTNEIKFLETLLPTLLSEEETGKLIEDIVATNGYSSPRDFGKVMGELKKVKNLDMKLASQIVKLKLV